MKVQIYYLIDSISMQPFYVGATKNPLKDRLIGHLVVSKRALPYKKGYQIERNEYIQSVYKKGGSICIVLIKSVEEYSADTEERVAYNTYKKQGFNLLQTDYQFSYSKQKNKTLTKRMG